MTPDLTPPPLDPGTFRRIVEASTDGIVILGARGDLQYANAAARDLCGADPGAVLSSLRASGMDLAGFWAELRTSGRASVDVRLPHAGGKPRWAGLHGRFIGGRDVLFVRDVTERKNLEEELRCAMRTEAVGYLTASVVHDFNNLLTPILCLSSALAARLDGSAAGLAREIGAAAERAAGLVRRVLAFARQAPAPPRRVDVGEVVAELSELIEHVLGERIELSLSLAPGLGDVIVDREQLEQVLLNLAANARDAMPRGGRVTIGTASTVLSDRDAAPIGGQAGPFVALTVTDTGVGMSPQIRARLFDRYFTTKAAGTGLGLATAHRFVTQSGGSISVWSEPGLGTSVIIYLPRVQSASEAALAPALSDEPPAGHGTILVVDDDDDVRRVTRSVLEERGYDVIDARSAELALAELDRHHRLPDLVLVDVVMPRMNGRELCDALAARGRPVKALYMSGHHDEVIEQHGVRPHEDPLLRKAFTPAELARKVREVLDAPGGAAGAARRG
jgi:signal transduction histidine kinase/CheY-like chemotaxis protein